MLKGLAIVVVIGCVLAAGTGRVSAAWLAQQQTEFTSDCMGGCDKAGNDAQRTNQCRMMCSCMLSEAQKIFPRPEDYDLINARSKSGQDSPEMDRLKGLVPLCLQRLQR